MLLQKQHKVPQKSSQVNDWPQEVNTSHPEDVRAVRLSSAQNLVALEVVHVASFLVVPQEESSKWWNDEPDGCPCYATDANQNGRIPGWQIQGGHESSTVLDASKGKTQDGDVE